MSEIDILRVISINSDLGKVKVRTKIAGFIYVLTLIFCCSIAVKYSSLALVALGIITFLFLGLIPSVFLIVRTKIRFEIVELIVVSSLYTITVFAISGFTGSASKSFIVGAFPLLMNCVVGYFFLFAKEHHLFLYYLL